ncbi:MAG: hypothetical protein IMZ53_10920 [Thermoplasmata archaeon]|nr:hypothetical protein [Thermoplasmata archaeon]
MQNQSSGNVTFAWVNNNNTLNVYIIFDGTGQPIQPIGNASVNFFPPAPVSGSDLAIYFTGNYKGTNAKGFLYVNNYLYSVDITGGLGIITLDKNAYGTAMLYIFGNSISDADSMKVFDIVKKPDTLVTITTPATATVDDEVAVIVKSGDEPIGNMDVTITSPTNQREIYVTDNLGKISFTANEEGKWKLSATNEGQTATANVVVTYGTLALGIAEENPPKIGDTITIITEPNAVVDVEIDNMPEGQFTASSDGFILFNVVKGGHYTLDGNLNKLRGTYSFTVPGKAEIVLLDSTTHMSVQAIEKDKRYTVQATDSSGQILTGVDSIWISNPTGTKELLPLIEGVAMWSPTLTGSYILSVSETATTASNSRYILIKPSAGDSFWITAIGIAIASFLLIFVILLLYSKRRRIPLNILLGSLLHRQKRVELPIG